MSFLRWNYIVPRLVLLFVLLCLSEFGISVLAEWSLESAGSQALGARIDVASTKASLIKARVTLTGIEVANPDAPMTNLVEVDLLDLKFNTAAALRKKAVVDHGVVRGLRFGGERSVSGALGETPSDGDTFTAPQWLGDSATDQIGNWLDDVEQRLTADTIEQLQAPVVVDELRREWPARAERLQSSAATLTNRIDALQTLVKQAEQNPLRAVEALRSTPGEVADLAAQVKALRTEIEQLPQQAAADRRRIADARRHDETLIREKLSIGNLDAEQLNAYLLGDQVAGPVGQLVDAVRWVRKLVPASETEATAPARGVNVIFPGTRQFPDLLVRTLDVSGVARIASQPVELEGRLTDFTPQPAVHGKPTTLVLNATGGFPFHIEATLDRTGKKPHDSVIANFPNLMLPGLEAGGDRGLGIDLPSQPASVLLEVTLDDNLLAGTVRLRQEHLTLSPRPSSSRGEFAAVFADSLTASLADLPGVTTTVHLKGTLDKPGFTLTSTLGPAVAEAFRAAVRGAAEAHADELLAESRQQVEAELAGIDAGVDKITEAIAQQLDEQAGWIEQLANATRSGQPFGGVLGIGARPGAFSR